MTCYCRTAIQHQTCFVKGNTKVPCCVLPKDPKVNVTFDGYENILYTRSLSTICREFFKGCCYQVTAQSIIGFTCVTMSIIQTSRKWTRNMRVKKVNLLDYGKVKGTVGSSLTAALTIFNCLFMSEARFGSRILKYIM